MKDALEVIVGLKDESFFSQYTKKILPTLSKEKDKQNFQRWLKLLNIIIKKGKQYYNGQNENEIIKALRKIDNGFLTNGVLKDYYENGSSEELIESEIDKIYKQNIIQNKMNVESNSQEKGKVYVKSTNRKIITESGFASPLLLGLLTATIEISTVAYILLSSIE